jgi:hypothetical protein
LKLVRAIGAAAMAIALGIVGTACSKPTGGAAGAPSAGSSAPAIAASGSAATFGSARPAGIAHLQWEGTYAAKPGVVNVPEEAKDKHWPHDPASAAASGGPAIGSGTLSLAVTGAHGEVIGVAHGALGELSISGIYDGTELRANVVSKDPADPLAMSGFMVLGSAGGAPAGGTTAGGPAAAGGAALSGTMRVASRDAKIVRDADVKITAH